MKSGSDTAGEERARTGFTQIFEELLFVCSTAMAVALVDAEGESIEQVARVVVTPEGRCPWVSPYDLGLAAAHWQIVLRHAGRREGDLRQLAVQAERFCYLALQQPHDCALVLIGEPDEPLQLSSQAMRQLQVDVSVEAGWPRPEPDKPACRRVQVHCAEQGKPASFQSLKGPSPLRDVCVIGEASEEERAYRVTLEDGQPLVLVRVAGGFWYLGGDYPLLPSATPIETVHQV